MNLEDKDYMDEKLLSKFKEAENSYKGFDSNDITNIISSANKRKKKKIYYYMFAISSCACLIVVFCICIFANINVSEDVNIIANVQEDNMEKSYINKDDIFNVEYSMLLSSTVDITDINVLKEMAEDIVIAKVSKIDGGTNYNEYFKMYSSVNTIGEIEIEKSIKGGLKEGQIVPFIRLGGIIETSEYVKGLNEKRKRLLEEAEQKGEETMLDYKYIKEIKSGDIEIEEGKTYLMFICYDPYNERYEIFGDQYGLREYDENTNSVLNNDTNEYEKIESLNLGY